MNPSSTILRVKRKRGTDAADALLLACKRIRPESSVQSAGEPVPEPGEGEIENSVFKLVATVASQDAPVQRHVQDALSRRRVTHALRPSAGSSQRIAGDLRATKWNTRRVERYRILSSHRTGLPVEPVSCVGPHSAPQAPTEGDVLVFDIVQEKCPEQTVTSDPETILCNSVKLIREKLSVSEDGVGSEHREREDDYVYDLYYQEATTPGWIQHILSIRPYMQESELMPEEDPREEEVYEDDDDENEEGNWRNDYPEEEGSEEDSDPEERYLGYGDDEQGFARRSWDRYRRDVQHELDEDKDTAEDSD